MSSSRGGRRWLAAPLALALAGTVPPGRLLAAARSGLARALAAQGLRYGGGSPYRLLFDRGWGDGSRRLGARASRAQLRVSSERAASAAAARRLLGEWKARLDGQFEGAMAYPGAVTRRFEVPAELRPREVRAGPESGVWVIPATDRLTFGAGAADLVPFKAVVARLWCARAGRAVEIALFYPKEDFDERGALAEASRFQCLNGEASGATLRE